MILIAYIIIMMPFRAVGVANCKIFLTTSIPNHIVSYLSSTIMVGSYFEATQAAVENTRISHVNSYSMYGI